MKTPLQNQLLSIIRNHNMTIGEVERKAGLRLNSVRNIVTGLSKKPSAETMQAIADIFKCNVKDLLTETKMISFPEPSKEHLPLEYPDIFLLCVSQFLDICQQQDYKPSLKKVYEMICDFYFYTCETESCVPDEAFARWLVKRNINI